MTAQDSVLNTLAHLVSIPSVNPNYINGTGESKLGEWIYEFFRQNNIHVEKQFVLPDRFNVIAKIPSKESSQRIVYEAHMDTVSDHGMSIEPYTPVIKEGFLYGRGACDTKGGLAAMIHAVREIAQHPAPRTPEIWFAATIDEEYSYRGVAAFCERHAKFDAAIIAEPTELQVITASKGLLRFKITTTGTSAHSAKPHLGDNAILQMLPIIDAIQTDTMNLHLSSHPLLGEATCNLSVIKGGTQINFVPDHCEIEIDRRLLPHEQPDETWKHYQSIVDQVMKDNPSVKAELLPPLLTDSPLETNPDQHPVQVMSSVLANHQLPCTPGGVPFCSDASKFGNLGIPAMILGPGSINQAHAATEYVKCSEVEKAVEIYRDFALHYHSM